MPSAAELRDQYKRQAAERRAAKQQVSGPPNHCIHRAELLDTLESDCPQQIPIFRCTCAAVESPRCVIDPNDTQSREAVARSYGICASCPHRDKTFRLPRPTRWQVGITTAPRRQPTLTRMLESLYSAGWTAATLFVEPGTDPFDIPDGMAIERIDRAERHGAWRNFLRGLRTLSRRECDAVLMLQDDVIFSHDAREWLETNWPDGAEFTSLYCSSKYPANGSPWLRVQVGHGLSLIGGLTMAFSRNAACEFSSSPSVRSEGNDRDVDLKVGRWLGRTSRQAVFASPSRADHIGDSSAIYDDASNTGKRRSATFIGEGSPSQTLPPDVVLALGVTHAKIAARTDAALCVLRRAGLSCDVHVPPTRYSLPHLIRSRRPRVVIVRDFLYDHPVMEQAARDYPDTKVIYLNSRPLSHLLHEGHAAPLAINLAKRYRNVFYATPDPTNWPRKWSQATRCIWLPNLLPEVDDLANRTDTGFAVSLVARDDVIKNVVNQIAACILAHRVAPVHVLLPGTHESVDAMATLLVDAGVPHERVPWMAWPEWIAFIGRRVDLGLCLSFSESWCYIATDYLSCGRPVIGSSALRFIGDPIDPDDPGEIAAAITRVRDDYAEHSTAAALLANDLRSHNADAYRSTIEGLL